MGTFADNSLKLGNKLIGKYGDDIVLIHRYDCTYDPITGEEVCTEDNYSIKGQVTNFTIADAVNDNVSMDDLLILVPISIEVTRNFKVEYNSKLYSVINVTIVSTQDTYVLQKLQVRVVS